MASSLVLKLTLFIVTLGVVVFVAFQLNSFQFGRPSICNGPDSKPPPSIQFPNPTQHDNTPLHHDDTPLHSLTNSLSLQRPPYLPSKYVSIRAVYIDDRQRDGHKNATVFLVNIWKNITDNNLIVGCQVGDYTAAEYKVKVIGETPLWRAYPNYNLINHEEVLIDCFDVPSQDGDTGYVFYKLTSESSEVEMAVSERVVRKPLPHVTPTSPEGLKYNFTVLTCTKVFGGGAPWFIEWLKYQRHIGVDHVHIDADDFFFRELNKEKTEYVYREMKSGFLSIEPWVQWLANGKEVWYHNQGLILEDCGYRFRGTYDFMFVLDTDDFFVPRTPGETTVHYYLDKFFRDPTVGSCRMRWVEYFPDKFLKASELSTLKDGNVTSLLTDFSHYMQGNRKSVHRTQVLVDTATHYAFKMTEGFRTIEASVKEAYVAHVRKGRQPTFYKNFAHTAP